MIIQEILSAQSDPREELDLILAKLCEMILNGQEQDPDYYGMVAACVICPGGEKTYAVNYARPDGTRVHAERAAIDACEQEVGPDCMIVTTLSPCNRPMEERYGESCTDLLESYGISHVYCGYRDPTQEKDLSVETKNPKLRELCKRFADTFLKEPVTEAFDQPYPLTWEKSEADESVDALARLPDGSNLSIMFNQDYDDEGEGIYSVEFWRDNSQEVTGAGDAQRVFATVLAAIAQFIKKRKPEQLYFSANKDVELGQKAGSRSNLYTSLVQRYARAMGYEADVSDFAGSTTYKLHKLYENFADGKVKGKSRPGRVKRAGASCNGSVTSLRAKAKKYGGEKGKMYHWCANMKSGKKK